MTALVLLAVVAGPLAIGALLLRRLGLCCRDDRTGFVAWAWLVGCLLLGAAVQLAVVARVPPAWWWGLPLVPAALAGLGWRKAAPAPPRAKAAAGSAPFSVFVIAGGLFALWFVLAGMDRPCIEADEGNIWALKAKSLLVDFPGRFAAEQRWNLHPDYPQLNPLLQAWVLALAGADDFVHFENRWPIQLCDVALFVATAAALRHRLPWHIAAGLAALVLLEPEFQSLCRTAYADGMVALGLVVALDASLRYRDGGARGHAWLAGLGVAFSLWSKNETMLYVACAAVAAVIARAWVRPRPRWLSAANLTLLVPGAAVVLFTVGWNVRFGLANDLLGANQTHGKEGLSMFDLALVQWRERVPAMLGEAWQAALSLEHVHALFAVLLAAALLVPRVALGARLAVPTLALAGSLLGLHAVYVGSHLDLRVHLDTSYLRVLFQLVPVAIVLVGAIGATVVAGRGNGQTPVQA